jgi:predicted RNase H-like HicB family nuclease
VKHYLAVLVPTAGGAWRAHFPDFPGCRAEATSVEEAIYAASSAAAAVGRSLQAQGRELPDAQTLEHVRDHSNGWASERGIDWSKALISVVPVAVQTEIGNRELSESHSGGLSAESSW